MTGNNRLEELLELTTQIVSSHVASHSVPVADVPKFIRDVYTALATVGEPEVKKEERPEPAVAVKKSVNPDHIVCLEDGKKLKMLKRHLMTAYGMSPEQYRERWNLPADYPMVAPNYAKQRSKLAKQIGLGTRAKNN